MSYQKCPLCNGTGSELTFGGHVACSVCKGAKIIHTITGTPPTRVEQAVDPQVAEQLRERLIKKEQT